MILMELVSGGTEILVTELICNEFRLAVVDT
jgi:hypothetical protein